MRLRVAAIWNRIGKSVVEPFVFSKRLSFLQWYCFLSFLPLFHSPLFFFFSFFFSFFFCLSFHCYHSVVGAWMSLCVGAHGWVAGIASHGSVLLSRGWDNVRTDCGFDRSNFRLAGHVDRSKFNRIENET